MTGRKVKIRKIGNRRLRSKKEMAHKGLARGTGRWHSRTSLWKSKRRDRRKRQIANESRRCNRPA